MVRHFGHGLGCHSDTPWHPVAQVRLVASDHATDRRPPLPHPPNPPLKLLPRHLLERAWGWNRQREAGGGV